MNQHFQFQPQITTFSINQVDEDDIPEEKMHCLVIIIFFNYNLHRHFIIKTHHFNNKLNSSANTIWIST